MTTTQRLAKATAIAAAVAALASGTAQAAGDDWQQTAVIYGMGAALDGDATVGTLTVPVDLSISDVFDALELGAMAAYRIANDTWSFSGDFTYMGLGATGKGSKTGLVKGDVDIDQTTFMATAGRQVTPNLEALVSLAYMDLSAHVKVTTTGPGGLVNEKAATTANWIDPLLGAAYHLPLADAWQLNLRGDVGGFGVGADLTYQLMANVRWKANDRMGVVFGYRLIAFDYEDGDKGTPHYQHYDLTEQGPLVGMTIEF